MISRVGVRPVLSDPSLNPASVSSPATSLIDRSTARGGRGSGRISSVRCTPPPPLRTPPPPYPIFYFPFDVPHNPPPPSSLIILCLFPLTGAVMAELPLDELDLSVGAEHLHCENYWKRRCMRRFGGATGAGCDISEHGLSWKRLFFERHLWRMLEDYRPLDGEGSAESLLEKVRGILGPLELIPPSPFVSLLPFSSRSFHVKKRNFRSFIRVKVQAYQDFVFSLVLRKAPVDLPLDAICSALPNLSTLDVRYGSTAGEGIGYNRLSAGMGPSDAATLGSALVASASLTSLLLRNGRLNDDAVRILTSCLRGTAAPSLLAHLDVSHNKITTNGMRLLVQTFAEAPGGSALYSLDLSDNCIHAEGGRALGRLLRSNTVLTSLSVGLNRLEDAGGRMLLEGLMENSTLRQLNLSANALGSESAEVLAAVLERKTTRLEAVDLSSNLLSEEDVAKISPSVILNSHLFSLDL